MQGRALTPDVILSGNLSVSKTVNLQNKVIYHNGQYEADDGYDGLGKVTVDVHNEMTDLKATENGLYFPPEGYDGFDRVDVDVPDPELDTIHITQNGRYTPPSGVVGYDDIHVHVNLNLESKTITANGHYEPSQGKNGFSEVTVNVPERVPVIESKSITENGTYTAPTGVDGYSPITVNVPLPANAYLLKELSNLPQPIASFSDGADAVMQSLKVDIEPVQSGSGVPSPTNVRPISGWTEEVIGVSGKNILPLVVNDIKAINTTGTWNDNTYSVDGVTYTIVTDYDGNITGIQASGTATSNALLNLAYPYTAPIDCILNGCPDNGSGSTYQMAITGVGTEQGNGLNISKGSSGNLYIRISNGYTANALMFYPMIRKSTDSDATFSPYNPNGTTTTIPFTDGQGQSVEVYYGNIDIVNGTLTDISDNNEKIVIDGVNEKVSGVWGVTSNGYAVYKSMPVPRPKSVNVMCDKFKYSTQGWTDMPLNSYIGGSGVYTNWTFILPATVTSQEEANAWFAQNPTTVVYKKTTPVTYPQQPTSIKSLDGVNNLWASTGDVTDLEYFTQVQ